MPQDCMLSQAWISEGYGTHLKITCVHHPEFSILMEYWPSAVEANQILEKHKKEVGG